jgi:hypothetical protein
MGTFQMWWRVAPKTEAGRAAKFIVGSLIGGGSLTLVYEYIGPFLRDHSEIVLPFALANALSSGFWYTLSEAVFGVEVLMGSVSAVAAGTRVASVTEMVAGEQVIKFIKRLPLAGTAVGILTAVTAPLLWPMMFDICWGSSLRELILGSRDIDGPTLLRSNWLVDAYSNFTLPLAVPVGAVAGATLHTVLQPYVFCSMFFLSFFFRLYGHLCLSLSIIYCLPALSDPTWHESNHHSRPPSIDTILTSLIITLQVRTGHARQVVDANQSTAPHGGDVRQCAVLHIQQKRRG